VSDLSHTIFAPSALSRTSEDTVWLYRYNGCALNKTLNKLTPFHPQCNNGSNTKVHLFVTFLF